MRVTKFLFLVLLGLLTLARAQPAPGGTEESGGQPQLTVDGIMGELRDDQGVDRDDQLDPQACDPDLLEQLGDALMHKYFIVSPLRSTAENIAKGITGASLERQHVQLGLAYVSAKVLGIMAMLDGTAQSGMRQFYERSGGEGGGGSPGDTGEYAEGDTSAEGGGYGGEEARGGYQGPYRGRGGNAGGASSSEAQDKSERGRRGASEARRRGRTGTVSEPVSELLGQIANARWILLFVILVVLGIVTFTIIRIVRFFRRLGRRHAAVPATPVPVADPAMTLLEERFVRDEITKEEFEEKKRELEETTGTPAKAEHEPSKSKPQPKDVGGDVMEP